MTDLTDDQVKALVAHFPRPQQHRSGEPLLDMVYADPGNSGFYYREEKPDSVTCYVRIDHVARALLDARAELAAAQQREAGLVERAEKAEAERDKWFEGAGAHHVASMQQAQRADIAEAELAAIRKGETP